MKIALVHKQFDLKGGTERVLYRTAEGLRDRGHDVHLFCGYFRIPPPPGTTGHRVPCMRWPRTARLLSFAWLSSRVIDRHRCNVTMSFDRIPKQDLFRSGGGPHRVFLEKMSKNSGPWRRLWYRLSPYHRCLLAIEKRQLGPDGCRKIIAVYQQGKREIVESYGVPEEKVVVIHNGVDHERFHPKRRHHEGRRVREELGIDPDKKVVLFVGTGFRRKGLDRLLGLWKSPGFQGVYLLVVGHDPRLSLYRRRWAGKGVYFVGFQSRVEDYYAAADLFVLPSIQEAFGNVVLEALAAGLPVVTVQGLGSTDELEGDLMEGVLIDPDDPEDIKRKMIRQLENDRWPKLSIEARRVAKKYTWGRYFEELEKQLDGVAKSHD